MTRAKFHEAVAFVLAAATICNSGMASAKVRVINLDQPPAQQEAPIQPPAQPQGPENPQTQPAARPPEGGDQGPRGLAARVLQRKLGPEGYKTVLRQLERMAATPAGDAFGAPAADRWFDRAAGPRTGDDAGARPEGTRFFSGYKPTTTDDASRIVNAYGGIPGGGVVLEGTATGLDPIQEIGYDRKFNAFVLDGRAAYFLKIPPGTVAMLCRAIAEKDQVGVSLGKVQLVYGAVPKSSDMAFDLKLTDHFLGDIVFAQGTWTRGYRFAGNYSPQPNLEKVFHNIAAFFKFNGFRFEIRQEEVRLTQAGFDVTLVPLSNETAADGNLLPDEESIRAGNVSPQFESNARHVADNIAHYRREQIVNRAFAYGEVAAFLRWLKSEGADLRELAAQIE